MEVALWVVGWPFGSRLTGVAGAAQELADVIQVGVSRGTGRTEEHNNQLKPRQVFFFIVNLVHVETLKEKN